MHWSVGVPLMLILSALNHYMAPTDVGLVQSFIAYMALFSAGYVAACIRYTRSEA